MNEALRHLDDQPELWPRWRRGYRHDQTGLVPTKDRHLFIFVRRSAFGGSFGVIHPACHYVDGAAMVAYDDERRLDSTDDDPLCSHCFEVELQHGLASLS
jgi:hypothetical protein